MIAALWVALAIVAAGLVFLSLAFAGSLRTVDALRAKIDDLRPAEPVHPGTGVPIGTPMPPFTARAIDGATFDSTELEGTRHLVVFADPECRACDDLVPELLRTVSEGRLMRTVVVGRGDPDAYPSDWRPTSEGATVVVEQELEVSTRSGVEISPFAFVVDEGGHVVARSAVSAVPEIVAMIHGAEDLRILEEPSRA